jgi:hypothetical protein
MAIAQNINKQVNVVKQSGLGTLGSTGSQTIRRKSGVGSSIRDMFKSNEIVSHHQSTGSSYGMKKVDYKLDGELSAGTYKVFEEAMLEAAYAAVTPYAAGTDVTAAATAPQFVDASAGFLTAGLKLGDVVRWTGWTTGTSAANNAKNFWITALTAGNMSGIFLNGDAVVAQAATDSVTCTVVGKKLIVPLTSHTKDYLTIEDYYGDLTDSDLFGDMVTATIDYDMPATGNGSFATSLVGRSRTASGTQVLTSPTAETETGIMAAINGMLYVNGAEVLVTSVKISVANGASGTGAEIGTNVNADIARNFIEVTGSFTANLRDQVITALYEAETEIALSCVLTADNTATSDFKGFTIGKVRITGDAPTDSQTIGRTYPFVARINNSGGAALAYDETIISLQDSAS